MIDRIKIDTVTYNSTGRKIYVMDIGTVPTNKAKAFLEELMKERQLNLLKVK